MTWTPPSSRAGDAGATQQAAQPRAANHDRLVFGDELGRVAVVDAGIAAAGQLQDLIAQDVGQATRAGAAAIGVDQPRRPVALEPRAVIGDVVVEQQQLADARLTCAV